MIFALLKDISLKIEEISLKFFDFLKISYFFYIFFLITTWNLKIIFQEATLSVQKIMLNQQFVSIS
jgi:hypothetical protein